MMGFNLFSAKEIYLVGFFNDYMAVEKGYLVTTGDAGPVDLGITSSATTREEKMITNLNSDTNIKKERREELS